MATGGGGVQRRPQLAVAGVDAGAGVQQTLHDLHEVVDAALSRGGGGGGGGSRGAGLFTATNIGVVERL